MLSYTQEQSLLNAMVFDLVQESQESHRMAVGLFDRFRITAMCRVNGVRVQLFESGNLVDSTWNETPRRAARR